MTNREMDAIQVQDAVVGKQLTFAPGFILLGQRAVETTDSAGTGCDSRERLSPLSHLLRAHSARHPSGSALGPPLVLSSCSARRPGCETVLPDRLQTLRASMRPVRVTRSRVEDPWR